MRISVSTFWLTLIGGFLLSSAGYWITQNLENRSIQLEQSRTTTLITDKLQLELEQDLNILFGIRGLFLASDEVNRTEFSIYAHTFLPRHPAIQALEWIPRVAADQVSDFVAQASNDGLHNFHLKELINGEIRPLRSQKTHYYPVYYAEPLQPNIKALGFDLSSNDTRYRSLTEAMRSGQARATSSIRLVQETGTQQGVLFFVPIYKGQPTTAAAREASLKGFALGVYRIGDLFSSAIRGLEQETTGLYLELSDTTSTGQTEILYSSTPDQFSTDPQHQILPIANRQWQVSTYATPAYINSRQSLLPALTFLGGNSLSLLLAFYIRSLVSREHEISQQVTLRSAQLEASEARNKLIVKNAANGVMSVSPEGQILSFNPAAEAIFGYPAKTVIGDSIHKLIETPEGHRINLQPMLNESHSGQRQDGSFFPLSLSLGQSDHAGAAPLIAILTDDTERQAAQDALIASKNAAEEANRQKSVFLNMMSHELRTPLTVILGYIPLLQNSQQLPDPALIRQIANDINISGKHLMLLIDDLLDISKIEAGQMLLHPTSLAVHSIGDELISHFSQQAAQKPLKLINTMPEMTVEADEKRLRQILFNLIGNALKFTPQGEIEVSGELNAHKAFISVRDTGIGIPEDQLDCIFEAFQQVDNSSTRQITGSGLGLAITKRLVELHGGAIQVFSKEGEGTEFIFSLPLQQE